MKTRQAKFRRADGTAYYEDLIDHEGAIELAFYILANDPKNATPQTIEICEWVLGLGRMPTGKEFVRFLESKGVRFTSFDGSEEDFKN